jgi:hypothetical protein
MFCFYTNRILAEALPPLLCLTGSLRVRSSFKVSAARARAGVLKS